MKLAPRGATTAALALALGAILAAPAGAGTYLHYTCKTPSGTAAPTDGWQGFNEGAAFSNPTNGCAAGGALVSELSGAVDQDANASQIRWAYSVPQDLEIAGARIWRTFAVTESSMNAATVAWSAWPNAEYTSAHVKDNLTGNGGAASVGDESNPMAAGNLASYTSIASGTRTMHFIASCGGVDGWYCKARQGYMSRYSVHALEAQLRDVSDPAVTTAASGSLTGGGSHSGTESIAFRASDVGAGVYRALVEVDGVLRKAVVVDGNDGRCRDAGVSDSTAYEFLFRVPCKLSAEANVDFDTTTVPDGEHKLRVRVEDAAGNLTTVYGPASFTVQNAPPPAQPSDPGVETVTPAPPPAPPPAAPDRGAPNGAGASDSARLSAFFGRSRRTTVRSRYGRPVRVSGRLVDPQNRPIVGARLAVMAQQQVRGAQLDDLGGVRTDAAGRFSYTVPAGPSRLIRIAYRSHERDGEFADTTDVLVLVHAGVSLRARPRKARNGRLATFSGRVARPLPLRGVLVDLQARVGKRWRTFAIARTKRGGRYRYRYRFRNTFSTTTYRFRARVRRETDYPYLIGHSRIARLKVRP